MADFSLALSKPDWFDLPGTRFGVRATYRTLDKYSPRYMPTTKVDAGGNVVLTLMQLVLIMVMNGKFKPI
jgi:hypothetical protein